MTVFTGDNILNQVLPLPDTNNVTRPGHCHGRHQDRRPDEVNIAFCEVRPSDWWIVVLPNMINPMNVL
jgi:hypothetical protein